MRRLILEEWISLESCFSCALTLDDGSVAVTGNYLKVRIPPGRARNEWIDVRLVSEQDGELLGG